jgi:hypothetical protein
VALSVLDMENALEIVLPEVPLLKDKKHTDYIS